MIELKQSWRARLLWEILRLGTVIGGARVTIEEYHGENVSATITHGWWYRWLVAFAFWLSPTTVVDI